MRCWWLWWQRRNQLCLFTLFGLMLCSFWQIWEWFADWGFHLLWNHSKDTVLENLTSTTIFLTSWVPIENIIGRARWPGPTFIDFRRGCWLLIWVSKIFVVRRRWGCSFSRTNILSSVCSRYEYQVMCVAVWFRLSCLYYFEYKGLRS